MRGRVPKGLRLFFAGVFCAWLGFGLWKAHRVARELVDPPFYRPQPLETVQATYRELAAGDGLDPGGIWTSERVEGLELWRLCRRENASEAWMVLLLHGFGDDRWGTSPALRWFPEMDALIFTYRARDEALRSGGPAPAVTFGVEESQDVLKVIHHLEAHGQSRNRIVLMGRSLGASIGLLALRSLETEAPLGGFIWEGAPLSSRDFAERLIRGERDRWWHPWIAPWSGSLASAWAGRMGSYDPKRTDLLKSSQDWTFHTPSLQFLATQDRLAPADGQRKLASRFRKGQTIEIPTWHLNCAQVLGPRYGQMIWEACRTWREGRSFSKTPSSSHQSKREGPSGGRG